MILIAISLGTCGVTGFLGGEDEIQLWVGDYRAAQGGTHGLTMEHVGVSKIIADVWW